MNPNRRVLITGSRNWTNEFLIHNTLTSFHWMLADDITLVSGGARGADSMGEKVARQLGWTVERHIADWSQGGWAGLKRNDEMVALGADVCLAFIMDDSGGATYTANAAERAGIQTLRFRRYTLGVPLPESAKTGITEPRDPDILRAVETIERNEAVLAGQGDHG